MREYRRQWWRRLLTRELRVIDTSILTVLTNTATFFASTTLLILGGLLALVGTTETVERVVEDLPFKTRGISETLWELKLLLLVAIFIYAFFKFTWSLRQFNTASVLVGVAPPVTDQPDRESHFIQRGATATHLAAESFNDGIRAYYFAMAAMAWLISPYLLMASTAVVCLVLYRREFHSPMLRALEIPIP
jgi:uncharacterized membrane protein